MKTLTRRQREIVGRLAHGEVLECVLFDGRQRMQIWLRYMNRRKTEQIALRTLQALWLGHKCIECYDYIHKRDRAIFRWTLTTSGRKRWEKGGDS